MHLPVRDPSDPNKAPAAAVFARLMKLLRPHYAWIWRGFFC